MFKQLSTDAIPRSLHGPVLVDSNNIPRYWATIWSLLTNADLAPSTRTKKLRAVEDLYQHVDAVHGAGALDRALGQLDELVLAEALESWFIAISNRPYVSSANEIRWQTGLSFITTIHAWKSGGLEPAQRLINVEARLHRLSQLYRNLHVQRPRQRGQIRSLPASVIQGLYSILDPASPENPFSRTRAKWLAFVAYMLMLHQGLRRGELLLLTADAIKNGFDHRQQRTRYWLNVQDNPYEGSDVDPRHSRPSVKTAHSIRQIPISDSIAAIVDIRPN